MSPLSKFKVRRPGVVALLAVAVALTSCGGDETAVEIPGDQADARLTITNQQATLDARVTYLDEDVPIDAPAGSVSANSPQPTAKAGTVNGVQPKATGLQLKLKAEIAPPTVAGQVVQATAVSMDGVDKAMVSYNFKGDQRLGAIDWFTGLNSAPKLASSVTFNDSDISAVATDGSYVYAAQATDAPGFPYPAVLERLQLVNNKLVLTGSSRVALTSFAATSVVRTSNDIYVTSGDAGDVFAFDKQNLGQRGTFALADARWAAWDSVGMRVVVVQGGQPNGQISVFTEGSFPGGSMTLQNTWPFPGANVPESKSTVVVAGGKAFIAAGPEGVQIVCLSNGQIVGSVPRPDPASVGLDPSVVITNSVAVDNDLMFISNGEAGVYLAQGALAFKDTGCTETQQITVLGKLRFNDLQSVNHVEYANDHLFIAAGLGGVKIVKVK